METTEKKMLTVEALIDAPVTKVWTYWTEPGHITKWNAASADWHSPRAENDLRTGGKFSTRMEAKDGSMGFDFEGIYDAVEPHKHIAYTLLDGRQVQISFVEQGGKTLVSEHFEADSSHSAEMQQQGWQAIMDNFKRYAETAGRFTPLHFEIEINAPAEKVWHCMLDDPSYRAWTEAFSPGSHYKGRWAEGEKMLFLGPDQEGNLGGMVSRIAALTPHTFVSIEHLGLYQQGTEITTGSAVESWAGAHENYTLKPTAKGGTLLQIDLESNEEYQEMFTNVWPIALQKLKSLCEAS